MSTFNSFDSNQPHEQDSQVLELPQIYCGSTEGTIYQQFTIESVKLLEFPDDISVEERIDIMIDRLSDAYFNVEDPESTVYLVREILEITELSSQFDESHAYIVDILSSFLEQTLNENLNQSISNNFYLLNILSYINDQSNVDHYNNAFNRFVEKMKIPDNKLQELNNTFNLFAFTLNNLDRITDYEDGLDSVPDDIKRIALELDPKIINEKIIFTTEIYKFYESRMRTDYPDYDLEDFIQYQNSLDDWLVLSTFVAEFVHSQFPETNVSTIINLTKSFLNFNQDPSLSTGDNQLDLFIKNAYELDIPDLVQTLGFEYATEHFLKNNLFAMKAFMQSIYLVLEFISAYDSEFDDDFDDEDDSIYGTII